MYNTINPKFGNDVFDVIPALTSDGGNNILLSVFTSGEIYNTIKDMEAWSSPGPDGFKLAFINLGGVWLLFDRRLKNWKGKTLCPAGRTTMIKHVLNTLPSHYMGSFIILKNIITQIYTLQRRFWWGKKGARGIHYIGWKELCKSKALGGMAFRDLKSFNLAFLSKLAWKACSNTDDLLVRILHAKYGQDNSFLHLSELKKEFYYVWRSIYKGISIVQHHSCWVMRRGTTIKIWMDYWVQGFTAPREPLVVPEIY